jgi:ppGpp synthetase/RelA/SpoT-type nucleotidyltranferase
MGGPCSNAWVEQQVACFSQLRPAFVRYEQALDALLHTAAKRHAPLAIVQTRTKAVPSFAEKCLRKCHKYRMPAHQLTDLCGARLIARTSAEVRAVCRELEATLEVDWDNSDDARERLRWAEFGYRSIHYVVSLRRDVPLEGVDDELYGFWCEDEGCPGGGTFHALKAEIQVRTLAEHAWADVSHDLTYKGAYELPMVWRREIALMAAELEAVDRTVERLEDGLRSYAASYGSYLSPAQLATEMDTLAMVLRFDPDNAALAQRLGKLAMTAGDWDRAITTMQPFVDPAAPQQAWPPLLRDLGVSLGKRRSAADDLQRGRRYLEAAIELDPTDTDAIASLAGSWAGEDDERATALYLRAVEVDPSDYYPLLNFVDFELGRTGSTDILKVLGPMATQAIDRCRDHIAVGTNIPWALYSMARFQLLLGVPYEALDWYSRAIRTSLSGYAVPRFRRLALVGDQIDGYAWAWRLLLLARAARFGDGEALEEIRQLATPEAARLEAPVVIVAGGTDPRLAEQLAGFEPVLAETLAGFGGTVISGGTRQGVCGMVGAASEQAGGRLHSVGYLPAQLPDDAKPDARYDEVRRTDGVGFSPLEPLQNWIDLVASGIGPAEVTVIGVNGGRIAATEYRIALALGARVGVIAGSGREAARLLIDEQRAGTGQAIALPPDPHTVRAFAIRAAPSALDDPVRQAMGRELHRRYREGIVAEQAADPARADWDGLPADLQASNLAQADGIATQLGLLGYQVRPAAGAPTAVELSDEEVKQLAEMEHGRWNAERLDAGWTWGQARDPAAKTSPYLVPWTDLPEDIRDYDRGFVRGWPGLLARVGLEVARGPGSDPSRG